MSTKKRAVEKILVAKNDQNLLSAGTSLVDSNGNFNGSDGQLAVVDFGGYGTNNNYEAITAGDTPTDSPQIAIAQGTPDANNASGEIYDGLQARPFEISNPIIGKNVRIFQGKAFSEQRKSAWVVGADSGLSDEINVSDDTQYKVNIAFRGTRRDVRTSLHGIDRIDPSFVTPDYTALGTTAPLDNLVQNLVRNINLHSKGVNLNQSNTQKPVLALAIAQSNNGNGTTLSDVSNNNVSTLTGYGVDNDVGIQNAVSDIISDSSNSVGGNEELVTIDLSTAGSATGAEFFIVIALDESKAYEDREGDVSVRLDIGLDSGFDSTVGLYESALMTRPQGTARQWKIVYKNTDRRYSQNRSEFPIVELDNYISDSTNYDAYIIVHDVVKNQAVASTIDSPHKTIILVPTNDNNTKTDLEGVLNPYIQDLPNVNL